jgi:hypothetical protein
MFGSRAERTIGITEHSGKFGCRNCTYIRADLSFDRTISRNALEKDTAVIISGMESKRYRKA